MQSGNLSTQDRDPPPRGGVLPGAGSLGMQGGESPHASSGPWRVWGLRVRRAAKVPTPEVGPAGCGEFGYAGRRKSPRQQRPMAGVGITGTQGGEGPHAGGGSCRVRGVWVCRAAKVPTPEVARGLRFCRLKFGTPELRQYGIGRVQPEQATTATRTAVAPPRPSCRRALRSTPKSVQSPPYIPTPAAAQGGYGDYGYTGRRKSPRQGGCWRVWGLRVRRAAKVPTPGVGAA